MKSDSNDLVVVCGAGGFIGGHLVADLLRQGHRRIRAVDVKPFEDWYQRFPQAENLRLDLQERRTARRRCAVPTVVYNLAADMGGMGFIENNGLVHAVGADQHASADGGAGVRRRTLLLRVLRVRVCGRQADCRETVAPLKEADAYPAMPEDGYGWEKLFSERMCRHFREDFGVQTRVARYHNVYGPHGTWTGGREKAPAAICRKVIEAKLSGRHEIEIWGSGNQTRSFMYIDDCLKGTQMIMASDIEEPLNLGSDESVTINQLVDIVEEIAGITLKRTLRSRAPKGVNGRNSDNTLIMQRLGWAPGYGFATAWSGPIAGFYDEVVADRASLALP